MTTRANPSKEVKERLERLRKVISAERYNVHVLDKSTMTEAALDSLKKELFDLEQQYPALVTPDSPTQRVAGKPLEAFSKVTHPQRILSLNDAFSRQDLEEWSARAYKVIAKNQDYYCELKIDGLDIILRYDDGLLVMAATRGNGQVGEDVTQNIKTIESVPLKLDSDAYRKKFGKALPKTVYLQGEVYLPIKEFKRINKEQEQAGGTVYANPRNTAAGSIRQLDSSITAGRKLQVFIFNILTDLGLKTHEEIHSAAKVLGFKVEPNSLYAKSLDQVEKYLKDWDTKRKKLNYQTDGVVVQVNDTGLFKELGVVGKAPRASIAYKFAAEEATTIVREIQISIGRTGALTPIAIMDPVSIAGTTVSRASLHNADEVARLDLRVGDTVIIRKAGDIIPEVIKVLTKLRPSGAKPFKMPTTCPLCGGKVIRREGEAAHYCANPNCFAIDREKVMHFVSKGGLDVEHVGPKLIDKLFDAELISDPADLFLLRPGDLEGLEGFGERAAQRVIESMEKAKMVELGRLLFALGIRHVGNETAQDIARHIVRLWKKKFSGKPDLKVLTTFMPTLSLEDWQAVDGIGDVVAESLAKYWSDRANLSLVKKLIKAGLEISLPKQQATKLAGKTFVLTGTLSDMSREAAKQKISDLGGSVSSSVSSHTDYVVIGDKPGSKAKKAEDLGIRLLKETEFINLLQQ